MSRQHYSNLQKFCETRWNVLFPPLFTKKCWCIDRTKASNRIIHWPV